MENSKNRKADYLIIAIIIAALLAGCVTTINIVKNSAGGQINSEQSGTMKNDSIHIKTDVK